MCSVGPFLHTPCSPRSEFWKYDINLGADTAVLLHEKSPAACCSDLCLRRVACWKLPATCTTLTCAWRCILFASSSERVCSALVVVDGRHNRFSKTSKHLSFSTRHWITVNVMLFFCTYRIPASAAPGQVFVRAAALNCIRNEATFSLHKAQVDPVFV